MAKLTAKEKAERAKIKKQLQAEGLIPPDKKPLNRGKFIAESEKEFREFFFEGYGGLTYLYEAVMVMTTHRTLKEKHTLEAVGAAKALKIAVRLGQFSDRLKDEGRTSYKLKEKYDCIKDIIDL